jgi:membrane carboxypeptidase/penicillin-binding protein PbpC
VDNAAAVILDSQSGDILAMVGNPDYFDTARQGNVNAALTLRQPGSAIKPLTYAAALDPGWNARLGLAPLTPAAILADLPTTFYVEDEQGGKAPYTPVNYDRGYHGPVSVRTALASSYNIPAVKTLERIGVRTLQEIAGQAGISTFANQFGLALTLGGGEVKLLELTAAFGIFQEGRRLYPRAIVDIGALALDDSSANAPHYQLLMTDSSLPSPSSPVISPATAYLITDILADPVARIPAFGEGSVLELPFAAAVKTGTTTDWRDNWTIGYSTRRIVGVWVGNADNTPMLDVSGIDGAGPIWHDLMMAAHPTAPPPFARPPEIVEVLICAPSGLLPSRACPRTRRERFIRGSEPTEMDDQFEEIAIDRATGLRTDAQTPAERVAQLTYWQLPAEYRDWMVGQGIPLPPPVQRGECGAEGEPCPAHAVAVDATAPLVLSAPTSNIAYQLHPGLPREHQQIEIAGYVVDGAPWAELRLVLNGVALQTAREANRLHTWWLLTPGEHRFWLEGRPSDRAEWVASAPALVVVDEFGE